jgi:hypothetical protein
MSSTPLLMLLCPLIDVSYDLETAVSDLSALPLCRVPLGRRTHVFNKQETRPVALCILTHFQL